MTRQCQHVKPHGGQCEANALPDQDYCDRHCQTHGINPEKKNKQLYVLLNHRRRMRHAELTEAEGLRGLREEIAIAKQLLEERLNSLKSDADTIVAQSSLNAQLQTIERLVVSCHKLEQSMGDLLSRPTLLSIANAIVQVILAELDGIQDYEEIVDRISTKIVDIMVKVEK